MPHPAIKLYIVDDEASVRSALARLARSAKMMPLTFESVEEFIRSDFSDENACVIADVQLAGISGLELPELLGRAGHALPVIFVTAHDTPEARLGATSWRGGILSQAGGRRSAARRHRHGTQAVIRRTKLKLTVNAHVRMTIYLRAPSLKTMRKPEQP
jgi:DNA-binding NarL/FixJ family response regulator